ncbi:MAG: SH3 domain-containing protein [Caldilineaceae bacterium]
MECLRPTTALTSTLSLTEALQSPIPLAPSEPTAITKPANMNMRSGPGTNYPVATVAPSGSQYKILALNPNGIGIRLKFPTKRNRPGSMRRWSRRPAL